MGIMQYGALMDELDFSELSLHASAESINGKAVEVVSFKGKITNGNSYELNRKIHTIFAAGNFNIILDLSQLEYINSMGVAILFSIFHRVKENDGKIMLAGFHPFIRNVFSLMELPPGLETCETLEDARSAF